MTDYVGTIDRKIAYFCVVHKISHESFAKLMGMSAPTLRHKRNGYSDWKWSEILKLSEILGESPDKLAEIA